MVRVASGSWLGVQPYAIEVEAQRTRGLPGLTVVGLARGPVRESAVRVRTALAHLGIRLGTQRLLINLMPADLPKEASALDLPMALALLVALEVLPSAALRGRRFYGALSLAGSLEPSVGCIFLADLARSAGDCELILPAANAAEAAVLPDLCVLGAPDLAAVLAHLQGDRRLQPAAAPAPASRANNLARQRCLSEVAGQPQAKWALEVAAAGGHNLLLVGPPGSGKTMLARRLVGLLPPPSLSEQVEITRIQAAAPRPDGEALALASQRPFRSPHHGASDVALCGGGRQPRPGEITQAHRGVLFLDELPEFGRRSLEALRAPLESGYINVARAAGCIHLPAQFQLVAAMNPCPCGYYRGDSLGADAGPPMQASAQLRQRPCVCAAAQVAAYRARLSGPLLDRIDLHVQVAEVPVRALAGGPQGDSSAQVAARVLRARLRQSERLGPGNTNAGMDARALRQHVPLSADLCDMLEIYSQTRGLSTRALARLLKVARTLADLQDAPTVQAPHLDAASRLRVLDETGGP